MKTALIIGGSGGIGFETVKALEKKVERLFISYYQKNKGVELKEKLENEGIKNFSLFEIDVRDEKTVASGISSILNNSKIDIVVYSVSNPVIYRRMDELSWKDFQEQIEVQIKGFYLVVTALNPLIQKNHKIKFIVVLSDSCIGKPPSMLSYYITAKYGLMGLVKSLASELTKNNCTFNMVSPGMVNTRLLSNLPPKLIELTAANNPLKRIAEASDVSKVISFLASDDSDYLNGVNIPINGGNIFF